MCSGPSSASWRSQTSACKHVLLKKSVRLSMSIVMVIVRNCLAIMITIITVRIIVTVTIPRKRDMKMTTTKVTTSAIHES